MSEVLKYQGRLALLKQEAGQIELGIKGDIAAVRGALDPFADDLAEIPADVAAAQAVELAGKVNELKAIRQKIAAIERALGR